MPRLLVFAILLLGSTTHAQGPDVSEELRIIESTERGEDPLAIDESTGKGLEEAARALPKPKEYVAPSVQGAVLGGLEQVAEQAHEVDVRLEAGLAFVEVRATFGSRAAHASELSYRLALPPSAVVTAVRACVGERCQSAAPHTSEAGSERVSGTFLWAQPIDDARGHALSILLSPLTRDHTLTLTVRYVAEAPVRGGRVRFELPARGQDPRIAMAQVHVASRYASEEKGFDTQLAPERPLPLAFTLKKPTRARHAAACSPRPCTRIFSASPAPALSNDPVWLLIDASPSMEGPARGRVDMVLAALLETLPRDTPVHTFVFGQSAKDLGSEPAAEAPLTPWSDAQLMDLGPATRPSSVLALREEELMRARPRILVLSDGQLDRAAPERAALGKMRRMSRGLWLLDVGDGPSQADGFDGRIALSDLADAAIRSGQLEAVGEALRASVARSRAGEDVVREGAPPKAPPRLDAPWLVFWAARRTPLTFTSDTRRPSEPARVAPFASAPPSAPIVDTGMPAESVLNMLRTQLVPKARACLRSDRKGRADYAVALTFHALFARREIAEARVEGRIDEPLRRCLEAAIDQLKVPTFSGRIRVRYPIHTEREPEPPVIALEPEVDAQVERVIGPDGHGHVPVIK